MKRINFITELNEKIGFDDFTILRILYTPIIGKNAVLLYSLIHDYHMINKTNRTFFEFKEISSALCLNEEQAIVERKKLEAVGLLKTFEKADNKNFIFRIHKPLNPEQFRKNSLLYKEAIKRIGEVVFERIEFSFKQRNLSKDDFKDVTVKYQDIFEINYEKPIEINNTIEIALNENQSKDDAIKSLTPSQFIYYLTNKRVSPSQLFLIQKLKDSGLSSRSINLIIDYSYEINGKIVGNHIKVIAKDMVSKDLRDVYEIEIELEMARNSKKSKIKQNQIKPQKEIDEENVDWDKLFNSLGGF